MIVSDLSESDLAAAQSLLRELGYDINEQELASRLKEVLGRDDHAVFIAKDGETPLGLIHVYIRAALEKPVEAYIQSLVVSEPARRKGVGKALNNMAENWGRSRGLKTIALHTQMHRNDAVSFYSKEGYEEVAHSRMLRKVL